MDMILYVLNSRLETLGIIDTWSSLIWKTRLTKAGSFELEVPAYPKFAGLLHSDEFIIRSDCEDFMYITSIREKISNDEKSLIVSGCSGEGLFAKRLYPTMMGHKFGKDGPRNFDEVLDAMTPFPFEWEWFGSNIPIVDVPDDYLTGTMEEWIRYVLERTQKEPEEESEETPSFIKPDSYTFRAWFSDGRNGNTRPHILFQIIKLYESKEDQGNSYIFSRNIGNIKDLTYSYSEEDSCTVVHAMVNRNASSTVTVNEQDYSVSFEDLYISKDGNGNPILPEYTYSIADDMLVSRMEKAIYVDPIIEAFVPSSVSQIEDAWYEYTGVGLKADKPYLASTYLADGTKTLRHPRYAIISEPYFRINTLKTLERMETEAKKAIEPPDENYECTVVLRYEDYRSNSQEETYWVAFNVGEIVLVRDDDRGRDFYKRVEEIEETFDRNGYRLNPTFGKPLKTIWDKLKEK